jgi:hypothetical protein
VKLGEKVWELWMGGGVEVAAADVDTGLLSLSLQARQALSGHAMALCDV